MGSNRYFPKDTASLPVLCTEQEPLPVELRNALWTAYYNFAAIKRVVAGYDAFCMVVWAEFMQNPIDEFNATAIQRVRE